MCHYDMCCFTDPFVILSAVPTGVTRGLIGDKFSFNCTATGTGVQLTWYRNAIRITPYPGSTLIITNATPTDSGVYQCHWYSQQLSVYHIVTWALVISEPGENGWGYISGLKTTRNLTLNNDGKERISKLASFTGYIKEYY